MKLRLVIQSGSLSGRQFELEQGFLMFGRGPDSTLRFDPAIDPGVRTHHAIVQAEPMDSNIIDQRSTNGTFVNDRPVQRQLLGPATIIAGRSGPQIHVMIEGGMLAQQYAQPSTSSTPSNINNSRINNSLYLGANLQFISIGSSARRAAPDVPETRVSAWAEPRLQCGRMRPNPALGVCASR